MVDVRDSENSQGAHILQFFGRFFLNNNIFLLLTVELAGKYALVGILCLLRHVRWYVGN